MLILILKLRTNAIEVFQRWCADGAVRTVLFASHQNVSFVFDTKAIQASSGVGQFRPEVSVSLHRRGRGSCVISES